MIRALNQFNQNKTHVEEYGKLYSLIQTNMPALSSQGEELLRAQIVMAVSALDTYVHEIVKTGLIQIYTGTRASSPSSDVYSFSFVDLRAIISATTPADEQSLLDGAIKRINSKDSYQSPRSIEYAMALLGVTNLWTRIAPSFGLSAADVKSKLSNIVRKRNQIAHESDINPATMTRYPILKADADDVLDFIDKLVTAIHSLL